MQDLEELALTAQCRVQRQGIVFSVRPPKKSWKNIANLSGGEKTLSSLSLVFALHHYKPTPLYVMDEIDAALGARLVPPAHLDAASDRLLATVSGSCPDVPAALLGAGVNHRCDSCCGTQHFLPGMVGRVLRKAGLHCFTLRRH